ncbi:MAG TPA: glycosyltransferase [Acidimicrobiales bacterium]|nr:glycosyltransferase [Acidimicrobiales bacterium]
MTGPVLVDLQGAQSLGHRGRGISRYATQLALAMERVAPDRVDAYLLNPDLAPPAGVEPLIASGKLAFVDEAPYADASLLHLASPFELSVPLDRLFPRDARAGPALVTTVFDLIPEVFADTYLADPGQRRRYRAREELVRQADRLVAISRHSGVDATRILGVAPARLGVVPLAPSPEFAPAADREVALAAVAARLPAVRPPFVLYTGGTDGRKNVERLVEAWGRLVDLVRGRFQLVIACEVQPLERNHFEVRAAELGVADDILVTGWVADPVLVSLTQTAELAVWPSLYEGYGLPIAEALACHTPVIASATSAHPELLPDAALFDPHDSAAIASAIEGALVDEHRRGTLLGHARATPRRTWDDVAHETLEQYDIALATRGRRPAAPRTTRSRRTTRLAFVTPLPPLRTGVADYSARLVPSLASLPDVEVDVYVDGPPHAGDALRAAIATGVEGAMATRPLASLVRVEAQLGAYDDVVYSIGNSEYHTGALAMLRDRPGVVLAHDVRLTNLYRFAPWQHPDGASDGFHAALQLMYPGALPPDLGATGSLDTVDADRWGVLMARDVIAESTRFLTTSSFAARLARLDARPTDRDKITWVPFALGTVAGDDDAGARDDDGRTITTFGVVSATKQAELLLEAFTHVRAGRPKARLVFAGRAGPDEVAAVRRIARALGVSDGVEVTGALEADQYRRRLRTTSVAVQLRVLSNGEWSAALGDCLTAGVPTVVTDAGANREIPAGAVEKVASDAGAATIAGRLLTLLDDAGARRRIGEAGRRFAEGRTFDACAAALYASLRSPAG